MPRFYDVPYKLDILDAEGRVPWSYSGRGPDGHIVETSDGINYKVLSRVQIVGRPTDRSSEYTEMQKSGEMSRITIKTAPFTPGIFHKSILNPIQDVEWKIPAETAMKEAMRKGAKGFAPGQEQVGGPGGNKPSA